MVLGGDKSTYKVRLRFRKIKNTHCSWIMTEVFYVFMNTKPGCISEINAKVSENYLSGKNNRLISI